MRDALTPINVPRAYAAVVDADEELVFTASSNDAVADEELTASSPGQNVEVSGTLANAPIRPGSVVIVDQTEGTPLQITDDGAGNLQGDIGSGGTNTIDYETGAYSFSFGSASTGPVQASYTHMGNAFVATEREVVLVRNVHISDPRWYTVPSTPNSETGRTQDLTEVDVPAGEMHILPFFKRDGWAQADGTIRLDGEDENIEYAVLRLPS